MKRCEALETLFSKVDLSFAQKILNEPFHPVGSPGSITDYSVTATYTFHVAPAEVIVSWQGTLQNGVITRASYTSIHKSAHR